MLRVAVVVLLSALAVVSPAQEPAPWLREFLAQVPDGTAAVAAMTISADDVGKRILEAMSPSMREVIDDQLASKSNHAYAKTADLLRQLAQPLQDRFAVVVRKNEPDPGIAVTRPSPVPQVACVFWLRPGAAQAPLDAFVAMLRKSQLFAKVFQLEVAADQSVLEFCNPLIPGTGEAALCVGPRWFVVSNSGPLIKDLLLGGKRGFLQGLEGLTVQDPGKDHGVVLFQTRNVETLLARHDEYLAAMIGKPPPDWWLGEQRPKVERAVLTSTFPGVASVAELSKESQPAFEQLVALRLQQDWNDLDLNGESGRPFVRDARALLQLFPSAPGQLAFDQQSLRLVLERLLGR